MAFKKISPLKLLAGQLALSLSILHAQSAAAQMVDLGDFSAPATLSYHNSFTNSQTGFVDWYGFSVPSTSFNGITASISFAQVFGVQLTSELYQGSLNGNQVAAGNLMATGTSSQTLFGNAVQTTSVIQPTYLPGGDYLIKVSGSVIGSLGGSYAGIANMAPVPLPPSLPLVALGLGLMAVMQRRAKRK